MVGPFLTFADFIVSFLCRSSCSAGAATETLMKKREPRDFSLVKGAARIVQLCCNNVRVF